MNRWSNRFASPGLLALLAACHGAPAAEPRVPAAQTVASAPATSPTAVPAANPAPSPNAAAPAASSAAVGSPAAAAPVPPQAAQRYANALALMKAGKSAEAEIELKQLDASYPEFSGPAVNLGLLYLQASRLPEAEAAFKEATLRNPSSAPAGNELGIVERRLGKFTEAEAAYQRILAAQPDYAPAVLNLGVLYDLYLAQPRKALDQFERYLQLTGDNKPVSGWVVELRKRVGAAAVPAPAAPTTTPESS